MRSSSRRPIVVVSVVTPSTDGGGTPLVRLIGGLDRAARAAIDRAGGIAVRAVSTPGSSVSDILSRAHAVVLLGGGDVHPSSYGSEERHPQLYGADRDADDRDLALYARAKEFDLPVLAICRGMHIVNVAHGGSLVQHLEASEVRHRNVGDDPMIEHRVKFESASILGGLLGPNRATVRSGHHQAIAETGAGLKETAWAADGVVEALEATAPGAPTLAVQWHPEDPKASQQHCKALFDWLIAAAVQRADDRVLSTD